LLGLLGLCLGLGLLLTGRDALVRGTVLIGEQLLERAQDLTAVGIALGAAARVGRDLSEQQRELVTAVDGWCLKLVILTLELKAIQNQFQTSPFNTSTGRLQEAWDASSKGVPSPPLPCCTDVRGGREMSGGVGGCRGVSGDVLGCPTWRGLFLF